MSWYLLPLPLTILNPLSVKLTHTRLLVQRLTRFMIRAITWQCTRQPLKSVRPHLPGCAPRHLPHRDPIAIFWWSRWVEHLGGSVLSLSRCRDGTRSWSIFLENTLRTWEEGTDVNLPTGTLYPRNRCIHSCIAPWDSLKSSSTRPTLTFNVQYRRTPVTPAATAETAPFYWLRWELNS